MYTSIDIFANLSTHFYLKIQWNKCVYMEVDKECMNLCSRKYISMLRNLSSKNMATFSASILSAKRQNKSTTEYYRMSSKNFTWEHLLQLGLMENLLTTQPPKANSMLIPSDYV